MKVYKFGGASVRNADGCETCARLSTMSKTSSSSFRPWARRPMPSKRCSRGCRRATSDLSRGECRGTARSTMPGSSHPGRRGVARTRKGRRRRSLRRTEERGPGGGVHKPADAELWYDTIVAFGELVSTTIISEYLKYAGVANRWIDMRRCFLTEQRHKDAGVDLEASEPLLKDWPSASRTSSSGRALSAGHLTGRPRRSAARLGLLGGRGGEHPRRRVDVGVEGCGRRAERRPGDFPRCRADCRAELPWIPSNLAKPGRAQTIPPQKNQTPPARISRSTCVPSATNASRVP